MHRISVFVAFLIVLGGTAWSASAHGVLNVPAEYPTLTDALLATHDSDIIFVQPGVYVEAEGVYPGDGLTAGPILDSLSNVTIIGAVAGEVIIDVGDHHHGFAITGSAAVVNVQGLTFRGNGAKLVSALDSAAAVSFTNCVFECGPSVAAAMEATLGGHRLRNCTFAGPGGGSTFVTTAGGTTVTNSIIAGFARIALDPSLLSIDYTALHQVGGTPPPGAGILVADPLFADAAAGDFHLRSVRGRWSSGQFVSDPVSSPCIDAGNPVDSVIAESWPHGAIVNLGALGATVRASRSPDACAFDFCGDCDGDGVLGITDALVSAQIGVGIVPGPARGTHRFDSCNVQGSQMPTAGATIDILDALGIARFTVGLVGVLSCCT